MIGSKISMLAVVTLALVVLADAAVFRRSNDDFNWKMQDLRRRLHERRVANSADVDGSEVSGSAEVAVAVSGEVAGSEEDAGSEDLDETNATPDVKKRLLRHVLNSTSDDYEPTPSSGPIVITFGLAIISVQYDSYTGIGKASVWEKYLWEDTRLSWDPSEFGGINYIRLEPYYLWTPDMTLYNSLSPYTERSWNNLILYSDGTILWVPRALYETFCERNREEVTCYYKVGPWTYDSNTVDVAVYDTNNLEDGEWTTEGVDVSEFDERCGARIISSRAQIQQKIYECCDEPFASFEAEVTFTPRQRGNWY